MMDEDCDFSLNISSSNDNDFTWPSQTPLTSSKTAPIPSPRSALSGRDPPEQKDLPWGKGSDKHADKKATKVLTGQARLLAKRSSVVTSTVKSSDDSTVTDNITTKIPQTKEAVVSFEDYAPAAKPKYKSLTEAEDPHRYHAKPRDLATSDTLLRPSNTLHSSDYIFSDASFKTLPLDSRISDLLTKPKAEGGFGLKTATRCQQMALPLLLKHQNVLVRSETGSGKTLSYLLPIMNDLISISPKISRADGTMAVIIAPTRELCAQISGVYEALSKAGIWLVGGCISGGEKKKSEKARLRKGVSVLVSTPGRLLDHLKTTESFELKRLKWLVFDEADRLFDMGFEQIILEILSILRGEELTDLKASAKSKHGTHEGSKVENRADTSIGLNKNRQQHMLLAAKKCSDLGNLTHIMASATLTGAVRRLAGPIMGNKEFVIVDADSRSTNDTKSEKSSKSELDPSSDKVLDFGDDDNVPIAAGPPPNAMTSFDNLEQVEAPRQLAQYFMYVTCKWRLAALLSFLKQHSHQKVMVFFSTCDSVDYHALLLKEAIWPQHLDDPLSSEDSSLNHNNDFLNPPASQFTGAYGNKCKLYRLHGSIPQKTRQEAFKSFCDTKSGIMLCTDVAARGLDLPHVDWILQYDPPCETTDYVHRIGRTARRGLGGSALIFLLPSESGYVNLLSSHGLNPTALSLQGLFIDTVAHVEGSSKFKNSDEMCAVILQRRMERTVHKNKYLTAAGRQAYRSYIRAYATHSSDSKGIFQVQLLHLGHLAKSFALAENITTLRNHDDVISKIMNGTFTADSIKTAEMTPAQKKAARDQKYSLSGGKRSLRDSQSGNASHTDKRRKTQGSGADTASGPSNEGGNRNDGGGKHSVKNKLAKMKAATQRVRKMGKQSSSGEGSVNNSGSTVAPSGRFRKTSGYFKKQLRSQSTFEFTG